ncbi:MAG TPA: phosphoglycerate mutase [Nitrosomonas sp.]|nr:phosphoglycerate mutase [Nitrosomonas sp.]HNB01312.1 phosphoglycerate mutase [Nitrosomonas sp.]HND35276.1 phosphoglycerate mutase [Nitrosomonas sp.]HNG35270.1 phosphoglycerate mutase [Nitrosomonas sp.]HNJ37773.1 phosphoglycerate mutase [Nitrosomonas sp.]
MINSSLLTYKPSMHIHLLIPNLFWSDTSLKETIKNWSLPALETILTKSQLNQQPSEGIEAWLCETFGISKQQDWPIAPITLNLDDPNYSLKSSSKYWLRADPVHLRIANNHLLLADSQMFKISLTEASQITDTFNRYFSKDEISFAAFYPDRWYMGLPRIPNLQTRPLSYVSGKNINAQLPMTTEKGLAHKILNEVQMLLHEHPINLAREIQGELIINSVWLWGGGILPKQFCCNFDQVWSNYPITQALANLCNAPHYPLPPDTNEWLQSTNEGNHLVVIDLLQKKAQYKIINEWYDCINQLEQKWFSPLLNGIKKDQIKQLTIHTFNQDLVKQFKLTPRGLWKFWSFNKAFSTFH